MAKRSPKRRASGPSVGSSQLRIIAGRWRGRKLGFLELPEIRPTPDRVRETMFNWLQASIPGASCLDLFAGSGALGFEAASRGASRVVMVDAHPLVISSLKAAKEQLNADEIEIVQAESEYWLQGCDQQFDLVFLDPPFSRPDLLATSLATLSGKDIIKPAGRIYLETSVNTDIAEYVEGFWSVLHSQRAGRVSYHLVAPAE